MKRCKTKIETFKKEKIVVRREIGKETNSGRGTDR